MRVDPRPRYEEPDSTSAGRTLGFLLLAFTAGAAVEWAMGTWEWVWPIVVALVAVGVVRLIFWAMADDEVDPPPPSFGGGL